MSDETPPSNRHNPPQVSWQQVIMFGMFMATIVAVAWLVTH